MVGEPLLPVIFLFTIVRNPVEQSTQVLGLGGLDGGFGQNGAAAHLHETLILLVVLHFKNISNFDLNHKAFCYRSKS